MKYDGKELQGTDAHERTVFPPFLFIYRQFSLHEGSSRRRIRRRQRPGSGGGSIPRLNFKKRVHKRQSNISPHGCAHDRRLCLYVFKCSENAVGPRNVLCCSNAVTSSRRQRTVSFGDVVRGEEAGRLDGITEDINRSGKISWVV